ncbi:uncharacterized protein FFB20_13818 [Fusarium fujikuroi]|nr:uncharacterized protein FFB20_13818 [Fusarium fujikuroi]
MFCEHLSVFKRFGEYSLTDYYIRMLSGKVSAWLISELDSPSRNRLLNLPITEFGHKLTKRFKRLDTDILNELHSSRYTPKVADIKEEKKVHWERKYPVIKEEDELGPDKVDTDGDSESVCSSRSISSKEAYLTYMTGNTSYLDGQKELFCGTCQRSFPSRAIL